ncbi:hypothetical protein MVEN_01984200 [Mycena venus]|uniref:Uncharacterized protein n=1 Tax=Mycena venus TaxID=2733690 RepID=A0A8H6XD06_9AGAR|nr:hypothetical protein MVEN_01984200 [Mycena venus]
MRCRDSVHPDASLRAPRLFPFKRRQRRPAEILTLDAVRTTLELIERSADICTPLKSAVGAVVGICSLVDRVDASLTDTEALAWRAIAILDAIYNSVGSRTSDAIPSDQLESIVQFEQLTNEIRYAMENIRIKGRINRLLRLRRNESQLATFAARLDSASQAFTIGALSSHTASLAHLEEMVEKVSTSSYSLEQSHNKLCAQIRYLQHTVVFFGLTPVFQSPVQPIPEEPGGRKN